MLGSLLAKRESVTFGDFVASQAVTQNMSRREKVTSCFAGLLAFSQIGACEVIQSQSEDNSMASFG